MIEEQRRIGDEGHDQDEARHHANPQCLAEEDGSGLDGRGSNDFVQTVAALLVQRLDGVEEEQETDELGKRTVLLPCDSTRRMQERGIEGTDRDQRAEGHEEDQGYEEVHPGPQHEVADLGAGDDAGGPRETERTRGHPKICQGGPHRFARDRNGGKIGAGASARGRSRPRKRGSAPPASSLRV